MTPFVAAGFVIASAFARSGSHVVYLFDMFGAAAGAAGRACRCRCCGKKGRGFSRGSWAPWPRFVSRADSRTVRTAPFSGVAAALALALTATLGAHLATDALNFTRRVKDRDQKRMFRDFTNATERKNEQFDYIFSRGSLVERIDMFKTRRNVVVTYYNAHPNDHISAFRTRAYAKDRRLANGLVENPDVLVIGTAAEGIVKTAKLVAGKKGRVTGLDINPAVVKAMVGPLYDFSKKAYRGIDLHVIDARSYFKRTKKKFHFITMMNTHRMRNIGYTGQPEYLHTMESMHDVFDRLHDNGWLVLEERDLNNAARRGIHRFIVTAREALAEYAGAADPARHFWVYDWYGGKKKRRGSLYTQIYVKKTPIDADDLAFIDEWTEMQHRRNGRDVVTRYIPGRRTGGPMEKLIVSGEPYDLYDREKFQFEPVADDKPFPFDTERGRPHVRAIVAVVAKLAAVAGLLPVAVLIGLRGLAGRSARAGRGRRLGAVPRRSCCFRCSVSVT
ncbi:MAG: class I SAM-dependent methyltransferase [Deltaproteobacteria bacterium]|nr:class I SAM-dependent methyltransferase [Deltaproteobacteria bacterium]